MLTMTFEKKQVIKTAENNVTRNGLFLVYKPVYKDSFCAKLNS